MVRRRIFLQQPHEVHPVPAGFLQLSAGIDPALVSVDHHLKQHSRIDLRFPASGRIGAIQFCIIQILKLGACQSDACVFRQQNFVVYGKYQLTISVTYFKLILRCFVSHQFNSNAKMTSSQPFRDDCSSSFWLRYFATHSFKHIVQLNVLEKIAHHITDSFRAAAIEKGDLIPAVIGTLDDLNTRSVIDRGQRLRAGVGS